LRPEALAAGRAAPSGRWTALRKASFAAGAAILVALLVRAGPAAVARSFAAVGWAFVAVVALGGVAASLNTLSWRLTTARELRVPFGELFRMLLAAEAVNALSPVGFLGGELVRLGALRRRMPAADALGSVVLAATAQFAGQLVFLLAGLPAALGLLKSETWRTAVSWVATGAVTLLAVVLLAAWRPALAAPLLRPLERLGRFGAAWERLSSVLTASVRENIAALRRSPRDFALSVSASFAAWQVGVLETLVVMRALGRPVGLAQALAIEVLAVAIEGILFFVPARMGTLEGGRVLAFAALGLGPADGLVLGLVRRARELAWAVPGLVLLASLRPGAERRGVASPASGVLRGGPSLPG
jgi:uncharacterized protein (TIRG00374 family)